MEEKVYYSEEVVTMAKMLLEKGVFDIEILDISKKTKMAKNLIIGTVNDSQSAKQIANDFCQEADDKGYSLFSCDGYNKGEWIVLDYEDIIVHIFTSETRKKYNLEKMWR